MCPTEVVVVSPDDGQHQHHFEKEPPAAEGWQETNDGQDLQRGSGVSAEASSGGAEHVEILSKMRDACEEAQDCSTKGVSDATLLRFLKARSMDVGRASKMFVEHQKWRASYVPLGYVPDSECPQELASKKLYLQGRSKLGWAVGFALACNHDASHRDLEELKRLMIHFLDKSIASAAPEAEKLMVVLDLQDIAYKNVDMRAYVAGFGFLQAYYPERLGKVLIINAPSFFMRVWRVVVRFLDAETQSKIAFVGHDQVTETCLSYIDADVLPALYGGKAELVLLQDAVVPNWPPVKTI